MNSGIIGLIELGIPLESLIKKHGNKEDKK